MMDRRSFVKFLALLAAGAAAKPEQIAAYEKYYDLNSPKAAGRLVCVDEFFVSGMATRSIRIKLDVSRGNELVLCPGLNAFGGVIRWVAAPDQKIVSLIDEFKWLFTSPDLALDDETFKNTLTGHISYIDMDGFRLTRPLVKARGSLVV